VKPAEETRPASPPAVVAVRRPPAAEITPPTPTRTTEFPPPPTPNVVVAEPRVTLPPPYPKPSETIASTPPPIVTPPAIATVAPSITTVVSPGPNSTIVPRSPPVPSISAAPTVVARDATPADGTQYIPQSEPVKIVREDEAKPGFWARNNPLNVFKSKPKVVPVTPLGPRPVTPTSSAALATFAPKTDAAPPPVFPRYNYANPARSTAGNRPEAEAYFFRGTSAHRQGDLQQALQNYRSAVKIDPSFYEAYHNLGTVALEAGNLPEGLAAFESALAANPRAANTRYNFAIALRKASYYPDAASELERVLTDTPNDSQGQFALANLYAQQLRQPKKAREHYERVLALRPSHPQADNIRSWLREN
jgi:Flp pilus assembly protein TadD